ncbi:aldo/keto reductase [Devosia riboflavina]|uniref:Aldo/keto reductase n=1 Tax=Devosia riboflavina TaxID=46914 RepID=A0A087LY72_9HYPH|nr:aldo/keto reductase [Devosia riboflavina]KFL29575.1 aldo/keto reductase [Devosia riboflavina]
MTTLTDYRLLGRSGLRVSPLALGTMTFGADWGWGAAEQEARTMFDAYVDRGGNFIDTSVNYTDGSSETLLGRFIKPKREQVVVATKFTMAREPNNPNAGGNHRLNIIRSVETSLRQLDTDWIDLLYLHSWDFTTGVEEVMRALDDVVRSGKVTYVGISNTPAWRIAQMQTLADLRGWSPFVALQVEYSLAARTVEQELVPMADALGLGIVPWSPLAGGLLAGKYSRADLTGAKTGAEVTGSRRDVIVAMGGMTERALGIADAVSAVARELNASPSQVAIAWLLSRPQAPIPIVGARTLAQLDDNLGALGVTLSDEQTARLDAVSAVAPVFPHSFITGPMVRQLTFGGTNVPLR